MTKVSCPSELYHISDSLARVSVLEWAIAQQSEFSLVNADLAGLPLMVVNLLIV